MVDGVVFGNGSQFFIHNWSLESGSEEKVEPPECQLGGKIGEVFSVEHPFLSPWFLRQEFGTIIVLFLLQTAAKYLGKRE